MSRVLALAATFACVGCSALFGLEDPTRRDASVGDDTLVDDADVDAPIDVAPVTDLVRLVDIVDAQVTGGPHTDFPVLVSTTQTWLRSMANGGDVRRDDGFDIYFSSDQIGASRLAFELSTYTAATGQLIAWVKVPSLATTSSFYLHYGSDAITTSQQNLAGTWSAGYELVMHMPGTTDASGTVTGITATGVGSGIGQVGSAGTFDGTASTLDATSSAALDNVFAAGGTATAWINPDTFGENNLGRVFDKGGSVGWALLISTAVANSLAFTHGTGGDTEAIWNTPAQSIALDTWQHVAVTFDKDNMANVPLLYINGAATAVNVTSTPDGAFATDASFALRVGNNEVNDRAFHGTIDETRLSSVPRSAGWIATEVRNQLSPSAFLTIGAPL